MPARAPRAPFLLSLVATVAGIAGLVSAVTPTWAGRLKVVSDLLSPAAPHVADGLLVASSLGLLLLGRGLARRRHRSWQAALWLLAVSCIGHLLKGRDVIDAAASAVPFALLWWKRADFNAAGDPNGPPRALAAAFWALVGLYSYGLAATYVHAELRGMPFAFGDTVGNISLGLVGIDPTATPGRFEHGLTISLATAAIFCAAYVDLARAQAARLCREPGRRRPSRRAPARRAAWPRLPRLLRVAPRQVVLLQRGANGLPRVPRRGRGGARVRRPRRRRGRSAGSAGRLRAPLPRARVARGGARRRPRASRRLARRRAAHHLHRRRGDRAACAVLARGPADPQGAAVGHAPDAAPGTPRASFGRAS